MNQKIGDRIRTALQLRGLTQAALAEEVGVSAAAVTGWVGNRKPPTSANVQAVADALDVDVGWLQFGTGVEPGRDSGEEREEYRDALQWYWQPTPPDQQRVLGDPAGHAFELHPKTLARETAQNTVDELLEGEPTVDIELSIIELEGDDARSFLETLKYEENLRGHLEACAKDRARKHAAVIASGLEQLEEHGRIRLIRVADYGANGLTGPEFDSGRFMAVCRNTLDSHKGETAGGSYGLGKATMWSASWMGVVVTNSKLSRPEGDLEDNRVFVRAELPWHEDEQGDNWNGPGWFGAWSEEHQCTVSYGGNATLARDLYVERGDGRPGATFLIVGAYDPSGETEDMESFAASLRRHLAESFWPAMVGHGDRPPRLRATVRTQRGRKQLSEQLVDADDYVGPMIETLQKYYEGEVVDELSEPGDVISTPIQLMIPRRHEPDPHPGAEHEATLLVAFTDEPADSNVVSKVVYVRGNNMVIREFTLGALPLGARQFHAVVLAGEAAGGDVDDLRAEKFLRAAEPPAHNKWTGTTEVTTRYDRGGVTYIKDFERAIKEKIREAVRDRGGGGSDGPESLKELLRLVPPTENPKKPRVKKVTGNLDPDSGEWTIDAVVSIPSDSRWWFAPALRFGTESGPAIGVGLASVEAGDRCDLVDDRLRTRPGARTVTFRAVSDPGTYPVKAGRARARLDLRDVRRIEKVGS